MEGTVARAPDADSDRYFAGRDRVTQLGAWASAQSRPLASREELEREVARHDELYRDRPVPRPPHWGGYAVQPDRIEFWYGARFRLHERVTYVREHEGWRKGMLYP